MQRLREQFLAGTALAADQHRRVGAGDLADLFVERAHHGRGAIQRAKLLQGSRRGRATVLPVSTACRTRAASRRLLLRATGSSPTRLIRSSHDVFCRDIVGSLNWLRCAGGAWAQGLASIAAA